MTLNTDQAVVWKQIVNAYHRWDPDSTHLMPVRELAEQLPAVAPDILGDTLSQAVDDHVAEVGHVGEDPRFRPLPV